MSDFSGLVEKGLAVDLQPDGVLYQSLDVLTNLGHSGLLSSLDAKTNSGWKPAKGNIDFSESPAPMQIHPLPLISDDRNELFGNVSASTQVLNAVPETFFSALRNST